MAVGMAVPAGSLSAVVRREVGLIAALCLLAIAIACGLVAWASPSAEETWSFDPATVWPWWPGPPSTIQVIFVAAVLAVGLAALLRRPHSGVSQALVAAGGGNAGNLALWETIHPDQLAGPTPTWFAFVAAGLLSLVLWSALVHVVLVFPARDRVLERMPWLVPSLYAVPQMLALGGGLVGGTLWPAPFAWVDGWARIHAIITSLLLVVALAGIAVRYWSVSRIRRRQVAGIAISLAAAIVGLLVIVEIPAAVGAGPLIDRGLVSLLALPIPVFLVIALWQDRGFRLDRLRSAQMSLLHAREEERRRLRRDLHDGLGPTLAAIGLKIDSAASWLHSDPAAAERLLDQARSELTVAMNETRRLVRGLRPPGLAEHGLAEALRRVAEDLAPGGGQLVIEVHADNLPPLPAAVEIGAYRIIHESLTNAVRHAGASRCAVRLTAGPDELRIEVEDDGVGRNATRRRGVGTEAMRERAEELGGELWIDGGPGRGTRVTATLPLEPG